MTDLSKPGAEQPGTPPASFLARAHERLDAEPGRAMIARISKDAAEEDWKDAFLRPAGLSIDSGLVGQSPFTSKKFAATLIGCGGGLIAAAGSRGIYDLGLISELQFAIVLCVVAVLMVTGAIGVGIASALSAGSQPRATWALPAPNTRPSVFLSKGRDVISGGEEEHLARHSAAALWELNAGTASAVWKSDALQDWRSAVDIRAEATAVIRAAGELQKLREALGDLPADDDGQAPAEWKTDYAIYKSGLAALRERVEQQLALLMAVEAIGRQLDTPVDERHALADRIAGSMPVTEQAVENLSALTSQSQDLLGFLTVHVPVTQSVHSQPIGIEVRHNEQHSEPSPPAEAT